MSAEPGHRAGRWMIFAMWLVLIAGLAYFFNQWVDARNHPNRQVMSHTDESGAASVALKRDRAGHFVTPGMINGTAVTFLVDTGATDVSIPRHIARRIGLRASTH